MNVNRKNNLIVSCFIAAIVVMIVALGTGCAAVKKVFGSETPAVASVTLKDGNNLLRALVRYDGKKLLVISDGSLEAEMYLKDTGLPLLGPEKVGLGQAVYSEKGGEKWKGNALSDLLPAGAAELFRPGEAAILGLGFQIGEP